MDQLARKVAEKIDIGEDISNLEAGDLRNLLKDVTGRIETLGIEFADRKHIKGNEYGLKAGSVLAVRARLGKELEKKSLIYRFLKNIRRG